jgi:hypothetical protein
MKNTTELPTAAEIAMLGTLQATENLLREVNAAAPDLGPTDTRAAEKLAVRLLTCYFGWTTIAPGVLVRPQQ